MDLTKEPLIIAFDTSCDDTSVAVLRGRRVLSNEVSSQLELHAQYGGVVPDLAMRAHKENIQRVYESALEKAGIKIEDIEYIAATYGPGLAIDLEVGLAFAKDLAIKLKKPFVPINHMEGHMFSSLLLNSKGKGLVEELDMEKIFPALGLLMSGKHTELVLIKGFGKYEKIGETLDDALGEAFDKVGRILNLGYPGGPIVTEFAKKGKSGVFVFPVPMKNSGDLNFSYSGLKTAALYKSKELREFGLKEKDWVYDFCRGFLDAAIESVNIKLKQAIKQYPEIKSVFVGGGVFNSEEILRKVGSVVRDFDLNYNFPEIEYRSDNAGMIGIAAYINILQERYLADIKDIKKVDRDPRLSL